MRTFIDTSSLFKKYVAESGSEELEEVLRQTSQIMVAPTSWIEFNSIVSRRLHEKRITSQDFSLLLSEARKDFQSYSSVVWNETLEETATRLIHRHTLSALDAIQLASGILAEAHLFVTSDRKLFKEAHAIIRETRYIA